MNTARETYTASSPSTETLVLPKIFNPTEFIGYGWSIWKGSLHSFGIIGDERQDVRSLAIDACDFTKLTRDNFLCGYEDPVVEKTGFALTGCLKREILGRNTIQADARFAQVLYQEQGQKTLRFLHDTLGITKIEFLGTILRYSSGRNQYVLYLYRLQSNGSWHFKCTYLHSYRLPDDDLASSLGII